MIDEILKQRGVKSYKLIAKENGMSLSQLRRSFKKHGVPPLKHGRPEVKFEDQLVDIDGRVKRKHFKEVQAMIDKMVIPYR